ncbi:hypothetical protein EDC01DRAFT_783712 [Geopyxis carbonaria]|nr:hypothetical protein EDC01DRAFT_783712 [Geopyxis carbonaria]
MSQATPLLQRRSTILAISAAIITAAGAYAGALLKTDVEQKTVAQTVREEGVAERIDRLKGYRGSLQLQRDKIAEKVRLLREEEKERGKTA